MLKEAHFKVVRTARYYTLNEVTKDTSHLWFVCHGYGQTAKNMIQNFEGLDPQKHCIVAPEGLSRFYWNDFTGKPVASWMTSDDRENEIIDYLNYLNRLYLSILEAMPKKIEKVILLGFSQGATTVSRWATAGVVNVDHVVLWGGNLAHDLHWEKAVPLLNNQGLITVMGDADKYMTPERIKAFQDQMDEKKIEYQSMSYKGGHTITTDVVQQVADLIEGVPK